MRPKPENASQRMAEVAVRVTPVAEWGGRRDLGAESGSRASGLVRTRRLRRHIPGNGGARPGPPGPEEGSGPAPRRGGGRLSLGQPESAGGGTRGPLWEGAEGAGPGLWAGSGAGLAGGEDWGLDAERERLELPGPREF